jgi:hypothetical protein
MTPREKADAIAALWPKADIEKKAGQIARYQAQLWPNDNGDRLRNLWMLNQIISFEAQRRWLAYFWAELEAYDAPTATEQYEYMRRLVTLKMDELALAAGTADEGVIGLMTDQISRHALAAIFYPVMQIIVRDEA